MDDLIMVGFFLIIGAIVLIFRFFSDLSWKAEMKKENQIYENLKRQKDAKDYRLAMERKSKQVVKPNTILNYYPRLAYPTNEEVYKWGEWGHSFKPEFKHKELNEFERKKGAIEARFHSYLRVYFNRLYISNNEFSISIGSKTYIPDFAYMDLNNSILIDIEIDEPYSFNDHTIIHYVNGLDRMRDEYFQRAGWAVIRFSEKQIAEQPISCCKFIAQYLAFAYIDNSYCAGFDSVEDIIGDKMWSLQEGKELLASNYRNSYLRRC